MLLVEENHVGASTSTHADNKMLHMDAERPHSRGGRGGSVHNGGGRQEQNERHYQNVGSSSKHSTTRGSHSGVGTRQGKAAMGCWYCGKKVHRESEC